MSDRLITTREIAALLRKSTRTIYRMVEEDEIPYLKVGGTYRFDPDAVLTKLSAPAPALTQSKRSTARRRVA